MVMKRLSLVAILFVFAFFVSGTVASEDLDQEKWWFDDVKEITEQDAEEETGEETSEEDMEQTAPEAEVAPPESDVKYVIEKQLKDTGLIFLPYGPGEDSLGEIRPSESYYHQGVPHMQPKFPQIEPIVFIDDEKKEGTEQEEGEEENEEGENDDDETNDY